MGEGGRCCLNWRGIRMSALNNEIIPSPRRSGLCIEWQTRWKIDFHV